MSNEILTSNSPAAEPRPAHAGESPASGPAPSKRGRWDDAIQVFLFFVSVFWLTNTWSDASEGRYHFWVARHFVRTGLLGFDERPIGIFTTAADGRTYGSHEFGNALLLIPTIAAIEHADRVLVRFGIVIDQFDAVEQFLVSFQPGVYAALTMALVYLILTREFGQARRQAFLGCMAVAFCSYFWHYSRTLYDGTLCTLIATLGLKLLLRFRATSNTPGHAISSRAYCAAAFAVLGFGVTTRLSMVIFVVAALGFVALVGGGRGWRARVVPLVIAGFALAPFAEWQLWYNELRTGNPLISPVNSGQYAENNALDGNLLVGLVGLLVSPGKGFVWYVPLAGLSAIVFPRFYRRDRAVALFVLVVGALWILLHAKLRSWYGAWGWGPRQLIMITPFACLPALVELPELWRSRRRRIATCVVLAWGFTLSSASIIGDYQARMQIAESEHRVDDANWVWGARNQVVDMLTAAPGGVVTLFHPPERRENETDRSFLSRRWINLWWRRQWEAGVPTWHLLLLCTPLLITMTWTGLCLLRRRAI